MKPTRPKKKKKKKKKKERKKKKKREQEPAFYIYILNFTPHTVQRQAVEGRQREQAERETDGMRTRRETERAEEEARASAREPKVRWTAGPRAQPPSDLGL